MNNAPNYSIAFSAKEGDKFVLADTCRDQKSLPNQLSCQNVANWKSCSLQRVFLVNKSCCVVNIKDGSTLSIVVKCIDNEFLASCYIFKGDDRNIGLSQITKDAQSFVIQSDLRGKTLALRPGETLDYSRDFFFVPIPEYWNPDITIDSVSSQYGLLLKVTPVNDNEKPFELEIRELVGVDKLAVICKNTSTSFDIKTISQDVLTCLYDSPFVQKGVAKSAVKTDSASNVSSTDAVPSEEKPFTTQKQSSTEETLESAKVNTL